MLAGCKHLSKEEFDQIEPLLTSAFKSKLPTIVDKTIELWNVLAKDEEQLDCSDSLKSVALSVGSSRQRTGSRGSGKAVDAFGAQAPSFNGPLEEKSLVVLSSNSSRPDAEAASSLKPSTRMSTRKRRMEETPEPSRTKATKRTSTPRLRHDNSQVQFTLVASSSPIPEDASQHLTERQKEVRERQRENENMYSDLRTSSPPPPKEDSPQPVEVSISTDNQARETTPPRATSYDNLISSTPTPRRGQLVQMDDNDPPSSPPIPRPYPLLSEIKSRSRVSNSLESWEFSSPPGSPAASDQEAASEVRLPGDKAAGKASRKASTRRKDLDASSRDIIPSSFREEESSSSDLTDLSDKDALSSPEPPQFPETPTKKRLMRSAAAVEDSPRSGDDEFVDARSSPEKPSLPRANDTSFALSEGDESQMMKLADELESGGPAGLHERAEADDGADERSSVQLEQARAPSPPRTRRAAKRGPSTIIESTPARSIGESEGGGSKRKRKRSGSRQSNSRSKKQRSENAAAALKEVEPPVVMEKEPESTGMETRGSARRQRQQRQGDEKTEAAQKRSSKRNKKRRGADTDDEVVSQLVSESHAAAESQSQEADGHEDDKVPLTNDEAHPSPAHMDVDVDVDAAVADEAESQARAEDEKKAKALMIMETLQNSLEQLRQVALPRNEVYKMEDVLMDLKRELFEAEKRGRDGGTST